MSEESYTVEERLEDALSNQIAELGNVEPGSDEYTNISRAITDLYKVRNEQSLHLVKVLQSDSRRERHLDSLIRHLSETIQME